MNIFSSLLDYMQNTISVVFPEEVIGPAQVDREIFTTFTEYYELFLSRSENFKKITDTIIKQSSNDYLKDIYKITNALSIRVMYQTYRKNVESMERFDEIISGWPESTIYILKSSPDWTKVVTKEIVSDLFIFLKYSTDILFNKRRNIRLYPLINYKDFEEFNEAVKKYVKDCNLYAFFFVLRLAETIKEMRILIDDTEGVFEIDEGYYKKIKQSLRQWDDFYLAREEISRIFDSVIIYEPDDRAFF